MAPPEPDARAAGPRSTRVDRVNELRFCFCPYDTPLRVEALADGPVARGNSLGLLGIVALADHHVGMDLACSQALRGRLPLLDQDVEAIEKLAPVVVGELKLNLWHRGSLPWVGVASERFAVAGALPIRDASYMANWTREQTLMAFRLYCRTPFGKLHASNPDIVALAALIGRTPSAVGMKACNFARLDPLHQARGVVGLPNGAKLEEVVWAEFEADSAAVADEAERLAEQWPQAGGRSVAPDEAVAPQGPTETFRTVKTRRVQSFFRSAVLNSYGGRCGVTGVAVPELLTASHIVPWAERESSRADPRNGICLNALHDRAFDRGLITFGEQLDLMVSPTLKDAPGVLGDGADVRGLLLDRAGATLRVPEAFAPSPDHLAFHRERVFRAG